MKIGILGAGKVGRTLGRKFEDVGYEVLYGTRSEREGTMSLQEVASNAHILLMTTPFSAAVELIQSLRDLDDKIVIDVTNPIAKEFDAIERPEGKSGAEHLQELAPHVRIVKAFNQTGVENLENPNMSMMFIAGDEQESVRAVQDLASKIGFDAHTLRHLKLARELESLAWLWIHYATKERKHRNFAFYLKENSF